MKALWPWMLQSRHEIHYLLVDERFKSTSDMMNYAMFNMTGEMGGRKDEY
jgi:hypothetical protein